MNVYAAVYMGRLQKTFIDEKECDRYCEEFHYHKEFYDLDSIIRYFVEEEE